MGSRNRDRLFGGRIIAAEMKADSAKKEAAEKISEADAATCQAWNFRMIGYGSPAQPSGGFPFLEGHTKQGSHGGTEAHEGLQP
jgi:hypothetical protein